MKQVFIFGYLTIFLSFFACSFPTDARIADTQQTQKGEPGGRESAPDKQFVLLELYTSQGCISCPPADKNLAFFEKQQPLAQAEIVTLAMHVDYWDSLSWKDEFSSSLFTRRQSIYGQKFQLDSTYTPQMVVDGAAQFVGNDMAKAQKAVLEAAKIQKAKVEISQAEDKINVKISELPKHENATVFLAIAENNLETDIKRGENAGKKIEYTSVVRELKSLGMIAAEQKNLELESVVQLQPAWKKENLKFVVFVQENESRKILGVSRISLS